MKKRIMSDMAAVAAAVMMVSVFSPFSNVSAIDTGWQTDKATGQTYYIKTNGFPITGTAIINDIAYSFNSEGVLQGVYTGTLTVNGNLYYYENGSKYTNGWYRSEGSYYYFGEDGAAVVGTQVIDGIAYTFDSAGRLVVNGHVLTSSSDSITIECLNSVTTIGQNNDISFVVSALGHQGSVSFGEISEIHRYKDGKWYKVTADSDFHVGTSGYNIINGSPSSVTLTFNPTSYKENISGGHYRIALTMYVNGTQVKKYCEFDLEDPYTISTPYSSYSAADTKQIVFTSTAGSENISVYSNVVDLFRYNSTTNGWELVSTKSSADEISTNSRYITSGQSAQSVLDLTRYSSMVLTSGQYRAIVGDGLYCDFKLTVPLTVTADQITLENSRKKQISVTASNYLYTSANVEGKLYYYKNGKATAVSLKSGKTSPFSREIAARMSNTYTIMLTDYYSNVTAGKYIVIYPINDDYNVYCVFDIE